ncbi:MAG: hypothetical protein J6J79_01565 [Lachnospiraceae bacterium]|nr:hypothetical protein [Lachnospiraceae bacterium]
MMISADTYLQNLKGVSYRQLIAERKRLCRFINSFEKKEIENSRNGKERITNPSPEVKYCCYLEYLSVLCIFMKEKYNSEYIWGDRKLSCEERDEI